MHRCEVEAFESPGPLAAEAAASVRAEGLEHRPEHLSVQPGDLPVDTLGHRKGRDAPLEAICVDAQGGRRAGRWLFLARRQAAWRRVEGRRAVRLQGHQIGTRRAREGEIEVHAVVDRIEGARGEEVEVAPLRIEGRRVIAEVTGGSGNRTTAGDFVEAEGGAARRGGEREGDPGAVR